MMISDISCCVFIMQLQKYFLLHGEERMTQVVCLKDLLETLKALFRVARLPLLPGGGFRGIPGGSRIS